MTLNTDSKTAQAPYTTSPRVRKDEHGIWHVHGYTEARDALREDMLQDGFGAEFVLKSGLSPVLYQHGKPHREQRAALAKFFSPATVHQAHLPLIEKLADELVADLNSQKRINLKVLSNRMATFVAAAIVGLAPTPGLVTRLNAMLRAPAIPDDASAFTKFVATLQGHKRRIDFWFHDVRPAIAERKRNPQNDVISYMISKGKGQMDIWAECLVYGAAGMATTQEFICIVLMHCLENPAARQVMLTGDSDARIELLNEILRLEPVIGVIKRKTLEPLTITTGGETHTLPACERVHFHIYDTNVDPQSMPDQPERLHPHRSLEKGVYRSMLSFGGGAHRCAGEHIAIAETDAFIHRLLKLDGLRIEGEPKMSYNDGIEGYEVEELFVAVN